MQRQKILLAGQQNTGKSTLFNMMTGARQHVANYPGVTIEKKTGYFRNSHGNYQLIDLPGCYSLSSYSLEERVTREALLQENADLVLNVLDAANLGRSLHLTIQLLEMQLPLALALNMTDVALRQGVQINTARLSAALGIPVAGCVGRLGQGLDAVADAIAAITEHHFILPYPALEPAIESISQWLTQQKREPPANLRWLAIRLLEQDKEVQRQLATVLDNECWSALTALTDKLRQQLEYQLNSPLSDYIVSQRQAFISRLLAQCSEQSDSPTNQSNISQKIDKLVLNRFAAPLCLLATVFIIYQASIVWGYELTNYWWPYLAAMRELIASLLPEAGFLYDPYSRSLGLWIVDSANTLLNYIPIFLILFALIAIIEDSGYMARIAFIADRLLHRFGLHGQSTLPMILAGVFAGGCAVPGIMACKGIADSRARLATILTVPYMNCLAKVPLYTLLLGIFFVDDKPLMTFYISTISIIAALLVAKLLTATVLRRTETAPFVMELPRYNLPTLRSVITRSVERTWMYVRKIGTIVLAVSSVIFVLLQFPGVPENEQRVFQRQAQAAVETFEQAISNTVHAASLDKATIPSLVNFFSDYKRAKLNAQDAAASQTVNAKFKARNPELFALIAPSKGDKGARTVYRALRRLASARKKIRREMKERRVEASLLGSLGRALEPVTQLAGFDWKINVALLSSFVARESSVATLGVLFQQDEDNSQKLEQRIGNSAGLSQQGEIVAVALILFFILYPPCLATVMMIKVQTGEYKWMLLSVFLPTLIGFSVAGMVYHLGTTFSLSGVTLMSITYFSALSLLLLLGFKQWLLHKTLPMRIRIKQINE